MPLEKQRQAIRLLLDEQNPGDGMAAYYAFHHDQARTNLIIEPADAQPGKARGYVAISQTGMDLFRPLLTMRLPLQDVELSANLLKQALPTASEAYLTCPVAYHPLVKAFYEVLKEEQLALYVLNSSRFKPIINVLVTREDSFGRPRFVIKQNDQAQRVTLAAAGLNWQSPYFAEIAVRTAAGYRRQGYGISVVSALTQEILKSGRRPLYAVSLNNVGSVDLARQLGFEDTGYRQMMLEVKRQ
ncbi:MAG: GNAT family N-acetyltransferase [Ardenticatenaceae bacterium]|nr:GNAT family N-acetyltransferase [Ardenticatenaceae bacterium]